MEAMETKKSGGGILGTIERVGNKLPHPFILFLYIIAILAVVSAVFAAMGTHVINPSNGKTVFVRSILSQEGLVWVVEHLLSNFSSFAPLGLVLAMQMAIGLAEAAGLLSTVMRRAMMGVALVGPVGYSDFPGHQWQYCF